MKSNSKSKIDSEQLIDNIRRANHSIQRRFFALITFSIIAFTVYFTYKIQDQKRVEVINAIDFTHDLSDSTLSQEQVTQRSDGLNGGVELMWLLDADTDSIKPLIMDSVNRISNMNSLRRQLYKKYDHLFLTVEQQESINIFGYSIPRYAWNMFSQITLTLIFLNFCAILKYRDKLLMEAKRRKLDDLKIGVEAYEVFTPISEFKVSRLPSSSSIVFGLFLFLVLYTSVILPQRIQSQLFDDFDTMISYLNIGCLLLIAFQVTAIAVRQNLLGTMTLIKWLLGKNYFDKSIRTTPIQIFTWLCIGILSCLFFWIAVISNIKYNSIDYSLIHLFLMFISTVIGTTLLPVGLYLFRKHNHFVFETMIFTGAVQNLFIFSFLFFDILERPAGYESIYGYTGVSLLCCSIVAHSLFCLSRRHNSKVNYFRRWIENSL